MTKAIEDMTLEEMDAFAAQVYSTLRVTEQDAEAKAVYRLGEFILELGRRLELQEALTKHPTGF